MVGLLGKFWHTLWTLSCSRPSEHCSLGEGAAPDAPLYTTLIRLAAPEWAKAFTSWINEILPRGHLKCRRGQVRSLSVAHNGSMFPP